ncbi:MAG: hypothetical protein HYW06_10670 [Gemmatimonadetes bacterium]|nr:hypothetical protein [Gemmatimonadota bacterium]
MPFPRFAPPFVHVAKQVGTALVGAAACAAGWVVPPAAALAQQSDPRSRDYLFITNADDVRALWVNPAGLGFVPEASVMAEAAVDRTNGWVKLSQYTLGLNSRGLGLAYQRDRSRDSVSLGVVRIGLGLPVGRGSIGAAMSSYGRGRQQGYDLGLRYPLLAGLQAGLVVRNINRPQPVFQEGRQPIVTVAGATWTIAPQLANVSAEAIAVERLGTESGFDMRYRGGFVVRSRRPWPAALHAAALVTSHGTLRQWSLGLVIGGLDRAGLVASASPTTGLGEPQRFSAVGVASRRAPGAAP